VLTTDQKGAIAEAAIVLAALELGIGVSRPLVERPYDFIFEVGTRLVRVQCKWAIKRGDVIVVRCYRSRRSAEGLRRSFYSADEVDAFAAYCPDSKRCYFIPIESLPERQAMHLRLSPTRNNQRLRVKWAEHFEFAATLGRQGGAVAQLGERLAGSQ
jgi:hypothetical protein